MILFLRVACSFALVGLLLWCFARAGAGRFGSLIRGSRAGDPSESLELLARRQISKNAGVVLVRSGTRHFLLGSGEAGLQVLAEGDDLVVAPRPEPPTTHTSALALLAADVGEVDGDADEPQQPARRSRATAWTRPANPQGSNPARMNLVQAIREATVRRS